jgi:hypothetical protein
MRRWAKCRERLITGRFVCFPSKKNHSPRMLHNVQELFLSPSSASLKFCLLKTKPSFVDVMQRLTLVYIIDSAKISSF